RRDDIRMFELVLRDFSGGVGLPVVEIAQGFVPNAYAEATLDTRKPRTAPLLMLRESDTDSGNVKGNEEALHAALVPSETREIFAGGGDTANQALFRLGVDESGDMLVQPITYSPGSGTPIISLGVCRLATSVANVDRLIICRKNAAAQILGGVTGAQ